MSASPKMAVARGRRERALGGASRRLRPIFGVLVVFVGIADEQVVFKAVFVADL